MKKLLLTLAGIGLALPAPLLAEVDPKIAEFCLKAQDFQGCVNAMTGKKSSDSTTTIRQINQKGADLVEGNSCPSGWAYVGGGNCQEVTCAAPNLVGHDYRLGGKGWSCPKQLGIFALVLTVKGPLNRAFNNPSCPAGEPEIGRNSTCVPVGIGNTPLTNGDGWKSTGGYGFSNVPSGAYDQFNNIEIDKDNWTKP